MKHIYTCISLITGMLTSCSITNYPQSGYTSQPSDITYQQFYNDLSPYGDWVDYQNYGYVWIPAETGFRPYYNNGHWVYTDYGWTWVSNYNWGWAPFHYGRWLYDYAYGWMWVPGYQWAPAWVSWRSGGDYYGWAPLGPGMDVNSNYGYNIPNDYWSFVPNRYINSTHINNYYINSRQNVTIINNTTIINNIRVINNNNVYISGPSARDVERNTHEKIMPVRIVQINKPENTQVTGNKLTMYRPVIKEVPQTRIVKPDKISNLNEVQLLHERNGGGYNKFPAENNNKPFNPAYKVQEPVNTQKQNPPIIINHQREIGQFQQPTNNQNIQPNPGNTKKDNLAPDNERLLRTKEFQQRVQQQKAENDRLNREKNNQQNVQENNKNFPVEKPQPNPDNLNKKNDQPNIRRFQNLNNNQQPPVKNIPQDRVRYFNQPDNNPLNKPIMHPQPDNRNYQNNNSNPAQKNMPINKPPVNNQPTGIRNENQK